MSELQSTTDVVNEETAPVAEEAAPVDAASKLEELGWSLAHEAEGIVRWVKRVAGQDAPLDVFGSSHEVALANAEATEAKNAPAPEVAAEEEAAPAEDAPADETTDAVEIPADTAPTDPAPAES